MQLAVRHNLQVFDPADPSLREDAAIVLPIREAQAVMGETVAAYLDRVAWRFELPTICMVNGECYGRAEWASRALGVNDNVEFVSRPLGGGSGGSTAKSIASVVALIALTAVAGPAGSAIGGALATAGSFTAAAIASVASAAIVGAGALAVSFFLSPKSGGKTNATDALYSFGLQGNAARPMQPIPVLNGRLRFAPDFGAPTYSEYDGDTMIDYALYCLTCGRMRVEQLLIGDTPIWDYQTGPSPDYPGIELQVVEPGDQVTLYPVNVVTADELSGAELTTTYTPGYIVNAAGTVAKQLLLDFVWPGGCYRTNSSGATIPAATHIVVRIRAVDVAGAPTEDWHEAFGNIYTYAKQTQIRVTVRIDVAPGRYEVSAKRFNPPQTDSGKGSDAVTWTALRAHIDGPQSFPRVTMLAVKGVASKQLSGVSGGQLRVIGTRILPVWRDGLFVEEPSRSIAFAALDWWRNGDYAAGLSLSDVDFQAFLAYDALWTQLGHTFDHRFSEVQNLDDVLETVLKAGRAFPAPVGDKLTITRDQPRGLSRMLFTENDIVRDSLEIDYALSDEAWADGMVGEYVDQTTWRLAEVSSAPNGVQLLKPARVQLEGVVDRKQATGMIRFMAAESQYRRITVQWIARMEGRLLKRGDLVKITAEEPETWGQSAEVVAVNGAVLTVDPPLVWNATGSHYVEIRRRDGRPWGPALVTRGGNDAIVNVATGGDAAGFADAVARSDTQERPWLAFSPGQPRTFPVLVTEGDPDQDGEHIHLTGVIDAAEVYTTTENGVPPLLQIPDLFSSALPAIIGLSASISQRQLVLLLTAGWQPARNAGSYVADVSYDAGGTWIRAYEGDRSQFEATVGGSDQMRVRVAGITPSGARGAFYIVEVAAPDISVSGSLLEGLTVTIEKLSEQLQKDVTDINALGQGTLALGRDQTELAISTANDTVRGAIRQLSEALNRLGDLQATQLTNDYTQRETIKLGTSANFAALERETKVRFDADSALSSITTTLGVQLTLAQGNIVANATAIQGLSTFVTNIDDRVTSQSMSITQLGSRIDANDLAISGQATATQQLTTRVTLTEGNISSLSQFLTALQSTVTAQGGQIGAQATAISSLETRASSVEGVTVAQGSAITALQSTVTAQGGQISGTASALNQLTTRVTQSEGSIVAEGQRISSLEASVSTQGGQIQAGASYTDAVNVRVANAEGVINAQATYLQALNTTLNGHSATLTTYGASIDGVKVQFGVTGDIDGQTGGFVFTGVRKLDGSVSYSFAIRGDALVDGTMSARKLQAYTITTAQLSTDQLIVNGQLFDYAASNTVTAVTNGPDLSLPIDVRSAAARVLVQAVFKGDSSRNAGGPGELVLYEDGNEIDRYTASYALFQANGGGAIQYYLTAHPVLKLRQPGVGRHTYRLIQSNSAGIGGIAMAVTELK